MVLLIIHVIIMDGIIQLVVNALAVRLFGLTDSQSFYGNEKSPQGLFSIIMHYITVVIKHRCYQYPPA